MGFVCAPAGLAVTVVEVGEIDSGAATATGEGVGGVLAGAGGLQLSSTACGQQPPLLGNITVKKKNTKRIDTQKVCVCVCVKHYILAS